MKDQKPKSAIKVAVEKVIGFFVFLFIVGLGNIFVIFVDTPVNNQVIQFVNSNLPFLIAMSVILAIGEIIGALAFPLNLPAPWFNAVGSVFLITFFLRIIWLLENILKKKMPIFNGLPVWTYMIVFIVVLVGGYAVIFKRFLERDKPKDGED